MYYSNGAFSFESAYELPVFLRRFYLKRLNKQIADDNKTRSGNIGKPKRALARPPTSSK